MADLNRIKNIKIEQNNDVSTLSQLKAQLSDIAYMKADHLAQMGAIFTVVDVNFKPSRYGGQWQVEVDLRWNSIDTTEWELNIQEGQRVIVSLPSGSRDTMMKALKIGNMLPMYNCYIERVKMENSDNDFLDLCQLAPNDEGYEAPPAQTIRRGGSSTAVVKNKRTGESLVSRSRANAAARSFQPDTDMMDQTDDLP